MSYEIQRLHSALPQKMGWALCIFKFTFFLFLKYSQMKCSPSGPPTPGSAWGINDQLRLMSPHSAPGHQLSQLAINPLEMPHALVVTP